MALMVFELSRLMRRTVHGLAGCRYLLCRAWYLFVFATSTLSIVHFPLHSQQLDDSELPTAISQRQLPIRFENLNVEDGLSMSVVMSIHQDRYGFMWFGTQFGVNRYDGYDFKHYNHEPFDSSSLAEGWITDIAEDGDGNLWFASRSGLSRMDRVSEAFTHYTHDPTDPNTLVSDRIQSIAVDDRGSVWLATFEGLDRMDPESGNFEHFVHDSTDSASLPSEVVLNLGFDQSRMLWISTDEGLARMDPSRPGRFERFLFTASEATAETAVLSSFERKHEAGVIWAVKRKSLIRLDVESGEIQTFTPPETEAGAFTFGFGFTGPHIVQDPINRNVLWINSPGDGLVRFDIRTKQFQLLEPEEDDPNSLSTTAVVSIYSDRSGIIWLGTEGSGVDHFNPASVGVSHIRAGRGHRLPGSGVWGILETRAGELWVATQEGSEHRVTRIDRDTGHFKHHVHDPSDPHSLNPAGYHRLFEDRYGTIWICGEVDAGLSRYDPRNDRFIHYRPEPTDPTKLPTARVPAILEDRSGILWLGTSVGLSRFDRETETFENIPGDRDDVSRIPTRVNELTEDHTGTLWLGTRGLGLASYDPVTGDVSRFVYHPSDTSSISSDRPSVMVERRREPGILWVGTSGGGLNRMDIEAGTFRSYTVADGLPDKVIYAMLEDEAGRLWMTTNRGLSRFTPETGEFRNYGLDIGLQALEFSEGSAFRSSSGEMFFGGINGLNSFFPSQLTENNTPPEVALVDLKLSNRSVTESHAVSLEAPIPEMNELVLDYSQRDITFDFVALHYQNPEKNQFAYMLEGFNDDWVMAGQRRSASFTNLAPGEYTFRVKAANSDGVWNEEGASFHITLEPPFWATWWFRILAVLAVGAVLFGGFKLRVRQIAERNRILEGEVAKRTSQLRESHDQLELTNAQLEQSHTIVEAINQETSFRRLLTKILEEARVIPGVEKASALVLMPDGLFHVRVSSGWDVAEMEHIMLTPIEAHQRYIEESEELADDIFQGKDVAERAGSDKMAKFGQVASFLVLRIRVEGEVAGYLVFDNLSDPDAFDQRDVELLERLREHIHSAFIKTRILEDLQNTLNDLKSTQDRLVQSEKMASLGQLTAGIAHEIKNPLNFVNNFSEVTAELAEELASEINKLKADLPGKRLAELESILNSLTTNTKKIREHGRRADGIVQNMLEHSKSGEGQRVPTDINDLLDEYLVLAQHAFRSQDADFEVNIERDFDDTIGKVDLVPQEMGRVFMNLIGNAFDALKEKGEWRMDNAEDPTVTVSTSRLNEADVDGVEIRISDNGPGIPEHVKARIFEPFFTTKPTGSGTGLGLSMSYDIVTKGHAGELDVVSAPGEGATFIVRLPI